ncbi:hypothetical protein IQ249_09390 [Lusitaniella coriacea LEGE 07157]|uniref:Uncharacterized protein n=1 Tax=Lusitaniella coriacea LEGE 07157 TaxID=945747 RepID=A0A8J7DVY8_9CYAN|nr:hypothetical protein [Lusitaniella coriacea]MBE9116107.1 hypothetical protein [Lusitaniella coriacea LEGE 07157]
MPPQQAHKIDLNQAYPCPSCRRGTLSAIALTEALGCNRCQQIFVLEDKNRALEQLSTTYPYKRSWRWTGKRWIKARVRRGDRYLLVALIGIIGILLLLLFFLSLDRFNLQVPIVSIILAIAIACFPLFLLWLSYRR